MNFHMRDARSDNSCFVAGANDLNLLSNKTLWTPEIYRLIKLVCCLLTSFLYFFLFIVTIMSQNRDENKLAHIIFGKSCFNYFGL